jgi:BirA family biotin operon repressor/biotin-[acetyl-CoA-carboxylase] ligase
MFDPERFRALAEASSPLGAPLSYSAVTGSTNDDALRAARAGAPHGAVFVAESQTAGRGRRGNVWLSEPGESLLFSLLLRPALELPQMSALSLAIGLALRDVVQGLIAAPPKLKWPNDLYVLNKKLSGILIESHILGDRLQAVVVGIGLNVSTRIFPDAIAERATSLALLGAEALPRERLLHAILHAIAQRTTAYERTGIGGIWQELNEADALLGQRVTVDTRVGTARGIDHQGRLLLESDDGELHAISSGTVERA